VQQHLPQKQILKTGLSVQAPSSSNNYMLKVAAAVQHIMTVLSETMSQKDKIMVVPKLVHDLMKQSGCRVESHNN
jgi:hypothetical protein